MRCDFRKCCFTCWTLAADFCRLHLTESEHNATLLRGWLNWLDNTSCNTTRPRLRSAVNNSERAIICNSYFYKYLSSGKLRTAGPLRYTSDFKIEAIVSMNNKATHQFTCPLADQTRCMSVLEKGGALKLYGCATVQECNETRPDHDIWENFLQTISGTSRIQVAEFRCCSTNACNEPPGHSSAVLQNYPVFKLVALCLLLLTYFQLNLSG